MIFECLRRFALLLLLGSALWAGEDLVVPPAITEPACCSGSNRMAAMSFELFADQSAWSFDDPAAWKWDVVTKELHLQRQSHYTPPVRSPINLAWFQTREWSSFSLTLECQLTTFNQGNNDLCIAFGGQDLDHFYYIHLGEKADEPHHQVHLVNHADRKPITSFRTSGTPWKPDTWHQIRIVRNAEQGDIAVWFDNQPEPLLTARDLTFTWGKIGLGSFDDTGRFRNVRIRGTNRVRSLPASK
ncbi:MAG: hypothetical protein RLZZ553_573 [Verrucomicrobiota bacterium]|jgi:hypothetical protein